MLISTIEFAITDFNTGISTEFLIEDTIENEDKVMAHPFTRCINYTKTFDFEFAKKETMPLEFIEMDTWLRLLNNPTPAMLAFLADI
jgi:hypothetical protein